MFNDILKYTGPQEFSNT